MPDTWDFSQRRRQADPLAQVPILTYLLAALSVVVTAAGLVSRDQPGSLLGRIGSFGMYRRKKSGAGICGAWSRQSSSTATYGTCCST